MTTFKRMYTWIPDPSIHTKYLLSSISWLYNTGMKTFWWWTRSGIDGE